VMTHARPVGVHLSERGEVLRRLTGHTGPVGAVAWGQLGDRPVLARDADEGTVRLWDPVIERFADRLPGYRSDDPTDPDRLGRDAEAATFGRPDHRPSRLVHRWRSG